MHEDQKMVSATLELFAMYVLVFVYNSLFTTTKAPNHIKAIALASVYLISVNTFGFHSGGCISLVNLIGPSFYSNYYADWIYYIIG